MSEWYEVINQDDVELSDDGKTLDIMFHTNAWGNQYVIVPIRFVEKVCTEYAKKLEKTILESEK